ncbi:hypothetical protein G647_05592 [Cladophialophora carrionii CBS 160.54]|uniref:Serine carboxypeptidase S28 n=1 Tax=Cladophialophora carrionii CBS 160.54 TaxID=1279043 RepID=V9DAQ7_9EURO|nr:uncharacterized protein G647_05592 [Cladophialophora carrionii CBS 160.54]ETI23786.1 hypothetical protein G647_05592 [Cladophialophora carrionii CBS 160.54]
MPIDHFHNISRYAPHTNATFQQLYWVDTSNYAPGGPVIVHAMGEDSPSVDLVWLQKGLLHKIANATGGVAVLWGQRYYSGGFDIVPNPPYTTENLRFHSTEQAMADLAYFAQRATFVGLEDRDLTAPGTPWIVLGGSYAGLISAFTRIQYPDLFWGGLTSSGVTTGLIDDWRRLDVVRRHGPANCVETIQQLTNLMDNVYTSGNKTAMSELKTAFNVSQASTYPDIAFLLGGALGDWQQSWDTEPFPFNGPGSYCSMLTSQTSPSSAGPSLQSTAQSLLSYANETATPNATSLYRPLLNLFSYFRSTYTFCAERTVADCLALGHASPFNWLVCTEMGQFNTGYTPGTPGHPHALPLVSRTLTPAYFLDRCHRTYNISYDPVLERLNKYGGFNLSYPRLAISTGQLDWFRTVGPLAEFLEDGTPNPRLKSNGTVSEPQIVIEGAFHLWDFSGVFKNETIEVPAAVEDAQNRELQAVQAWLREWNQTHASRDVPR